MLFENESYASVKRILPGDIQGAKAESGGALRSAMTLPIQVVTTANRDQAAILCVFAIEVVERLSPRVSRNSFELGHRDGPGPTDLSETEDREAHHSDTPTRHRLVFLRHVRKIISGRL